MARGASPGKSIVLLAAAVALACVALLMLFGRPPAPPPEPSGSPAPGAAVEPADEGSTELPVSQPMAPPAPPSPPPPEESAAREPEPAPEAGAEPAGESEPGVASGIGLFPPPGTDPIKIGIVVPEDFALPEGYLRHYQVTDDGQDLEPILLFHPDFEVFDEAGNPIPLPPDRVVPSELAPPGMPIRFLEVPLPLPDDAP
jgi:hypothetical protein